MKAVDLEKYNHKVVEYLEFRQIGKPNIGFVEDSVLYELQSRNEVFLGTVTMIRECVQDKLRFKDKIKEEFYYYFKLRYVVKTILGFDGTFELSQDGKVFIPFRSSMELKGLMTEQLSKFYDEIEEMENEFYNAQSDFGWAENHDDETIYRFDFEDYILHYEGIIYGQESDELPF